MGNAGTAARNLILMPAGMELDMTSVPRNFAGVNRLGSAPSVAKMMLLGETVNAVPVLTRKTILIFRGIRGND